MMCTGPDWQAHMPNANTGTNIMDFWQFIDRYGYPIVVSGALGYVIWKASTWFATKVVEPLVSAHVGFLAETKSFMKSTESAMQAHEAFTRAIAQDVQANTDVLRDLKADLHKGTFCRQGESNPNKQPPN